MTPVAVPADRMAACLALLRHADAPLRAAAIADHLGIVGSHETKRRRVREAVDALRGDGAWIVADTVQGYWLTADPAVWKSWDENRRIDAKAILAESHKRRKMIADAASQGLLFAPAHRIGLG